MVRWGTAAGFAAALSRECGEESPADPSWGQPGYTGLQEECGALRWSPSLTSEKIQISAA